MGGLVGGMRNGDRVVGTWEEQRSAIVIVGGRSTGEQVGGGVWGADRLHTAMGGTQAGKAQVSTAWLLCGEAPPVTGARAPRRCLEPPVAGRRIHLGRGKALHPELSPGHTDLRQASHELIAPSSRHNYIPTSPLRMERHAHHAQHLPFSAPCAHPAYRLRHRAAQPQLPRQLKHGASDLGHHLIDGHPAQALAVQRPQQPEPGPEQQRPRRELAPVQHFARQALSTFKGCKGLLQGRSPGVQQLMGDRTGRGALPSGASSISSHKRAYLWASNKI